MDFKDYINGLNDLDNQEARTELETFYTLNATTFKFFKALDATILDLSMQSNVNVIAKQQLEDILPILIRLRTTILELDYQSFAKEYYDKIQKSVYYIQNEMIGNEVENIALKFFQLLESNKTTFNKEQEEKNIARKKEALKIKIEKRNKLESKITTIQDAENFLKKFSVDECEWSTLQMLARSSTNIAILKIITEFITDYWDSICYSEEADEVKDKYEIYSLIKILKHNTSLNAKLRQLLEDYYLDIASELG